jgi:hypothetical protein
MPELWTATLNSSGPNFDLWRSIFGERRIPLKSPAPVKTKLGDEPDVEVYLLDLRAVTLKQRAALLAAVAQRFQVPIYEIEAAIADGGFPIRAVDVIVAMSPRAFL